MRGLPIFIVLGTMLLSVSVHAADYCDDKMEPGESPDIKAMMMMSALINVALAERYCGSAPATLSQIAVVVEEGFGCGPRARLEMEIDKEMKEEEGGTLTTDVFIREFVRGDEIDISPTELDRRAKALITELGGCEEVLKTRQDLLDRYDNPPEWPRKPGQQEP